MGKYVMVVKPFQVVLQIVNVVIMFVVWMLRATPKLVCVMLIVYSTVEMPKLVVATTSTLLTSKILLVCPSESDNGIQRIRTTMEQMMYLMIIHLLVLPLIVLVGLVMLAVYRPLVEVHVQQEPKQRLHKLLIPVV